jgi:hypothetical protein
MKSKVLMPAVRIASTAYFDIVLVGFGRLVVAAAQAT